MDARSRLSTLLALHQPEDEKEAADLARMRSLAEVLPDPFSRDALPGHFTASALVVDEAGQQVCFVHHKKLGRWLQPGGHFEPSDEGALEVAALREAREETGLEVGLHPECAQPLDFDIHAIPERKSAPGHDHLDVRYLLLARTSAARFDPEESTDIRWFSWEEALKEASDPALSRLLMKARRLLARASGA